MKTNLFLTAALSLSFCLASTAQTLPAYLPADGLVGWWPFNGNANDESGNGNDGVVNGATLTTDRFENTQNAYSFNGAGDHILISNSTSLNPEALTISCWALFNSGNSALLSKVDSLTSTNFGYNLIHDFQNMNNGLYTSWNTDGLCNSSSVHISTFGPSGIINNGIWQFITVTIDEFGFCRQFVNGSMTYGFQGQPLNSCNADESLLYFGKQWFGDPTWMNGKLDDIGIWGRALTDNEIQILYTANSPTFAASCAPLPSNLQNGLVGYWPFCGNANDESGNGNNGTVNGATLTEDRFGVADAAYDFDGVDDLIDIGNASSINSISLDFSISYWINLNSPSTNSMVIASFASGLGGAGWRFHSAIRGDSVDSRFMRSDIINWEINTTPQSSIVQNQWLNIVVVRNDNIFQTYINNDLASTKQVSGIEINSPTVEALTKIGVNWPSSTEYLNGMVDDIGIWNRALTPEEITAIYTGEPVNPPTTCNTLPSNLQNGLVGYLPFCGNANDESGNGNDGTVNGATLTEDRFGVANAAYDFDGVDDIIYTQIDSALEQDWSVNFWFKSTNPNNNFQGQNLIGLGPDVYGYGSAGLQISGQIEPGQCPSFAYLNQLYLFDASEECGGNFLNGGLYDNSQWHNVSILKNNLEYEIIIDNMSVSTAVLNDININEIALGNRSDLIFQYFRGALDDIAIYNRALIPEEVQQLYTLNACTFTIYDTVTVENVVTVYDTVLTSVTDTLIINTLITELAPPANTNTIKVFPNPAGSTLTIDYGNFALMNGYQLRIENSLGQEVFQTNISQQSDTLSLDTWGGNGLYFVHIVDPQGNTVDIRKIILQ